METVPLTRERSKGKGIPDTFANNRYEGWQKIALEKAIHGLFNTRKKICLKRKSCEEQRQRNKCKRGGPDHRDERAGKQRYVKE
ncbi:MAG: hypothetical protein B6D35_02185 [Candidatus Brocadia sp. UTAMX2]|jgi:hypothetical protein|nr:MAG: hypothetical protein B6D35_02185 [Candidatus Brocadia sp. UTAMX2]